MDGVEIDDEPDELLEFWLLEIKLLIELERLLLSDEAEDATALPCH